MQVNDAMVGAALDAYNKYANSGPVKSDWSDAMRAALTAAIAHMWRPVSEAKLDETPYLIATADGKVCEAAFYPRHNFWLDEYGAREDPWVGNAYNPTAIMPLPAPPKTGGE